MQSIMDRTMKKIILTFLMACFVNISLSQKNGDVPFEKEFFKEINEKYFNTFYNYLENLFLV